MFARRTLWVVGMLGLVLAAAPALWAQDGAERPRGKRGEAGQVEPGKMLERLTEMRHEVVDRLHKFLGELDLTDQQKADIKAAFDEFHAAVKTFQDQHKDEIAKLRDEIKAALEARDREKVQQAAQKLRELWQSGPKPQDLIEKVSAILTPEQREKLRAKLQEWREAAKDKMPGKGEGERPGKGLRERPGKGVRPEGGAAD